MKALMISPVSLSSDHTESHQLVLTSRLASPGPANDADLLARRDGQRDTAKRRCELGPMRSCNVVKLDFALTRPATLLETIIDVGNLVWGLLFDLVGVMEKPLDGVHVVLDLGRLSNHLSEDGLNGHHVRQHNSAIGWGDGTAQPNDEQASGQDQKGSKQVQTNIEPALAGNGKPICPRNN